MGETSSAEQDQWKEIAAAVRAHLAKMCDYLPAMKPEEVGAFVTAVDSALLLEALAETFDELVAARKAELVRDAAFGG